ncbi:hypothetical protein RND71_035911 [Anisodus tanguticus]|uniref:Uncharacterized protein n=1 Tax=Anisodus tanguticus TaxID=243964 RepID=A0AAE1R5X6_9SOLA|nr:hypothetical protein RND71_035911 [Anisodus tanguticus]
MAPREFEIGENIISNTANCCTGKNSEKNSLRKKCSHLAKKQKAKFYILRRCIAMLVCWHERNDNDH